MESNGSHDNQSALDTELYQRYLYNRSLSEFVFNAMIIIHAGLVVFGAVGNILVLVAISMVKSKIQIL